MLDFLGALLKTATDKAQPRGARVTAVISLLVLVLAVVGIIVFAWYALPILILLFLLFGDKIDAVIARDKVDQAQQHFVAEQRYEATRNEIAVRVIIPSYAEAQICRASLESLGYFEPAVHGFGFYFPIRPEPLEGDEIRRLKTCISRRLAGFLKVKPSLIYQQIIVVSPTYVFVKAVPEITSFFCPAI